MSFLHTHPYEPFIPPGIDRLIIGTLPPPRFTTGELLPGDVNFCYGSRDGLLWPVLENIFQISLTDDGADSSVVKRKKWLAEKRIGIFDIVAAAKRDRIDASDLGMKEVQLRNLPEALKELTEVKALIFTGGNSKNGPEYFFRKQLKLSEIKLETVSDEVPRIHRFSLGTRIIYTVSLTAPSGSANRAIGSMAVYKMRKTENPDYSTMDFRVEQYRPYFTLPFWEDFQDRETVNR